MTFDEIFSLIGKISYPCSVLLNLYLFFKTKTDKRFERIEERQDAIEGAAEEDREVVRLAIAERKAHISEVTERIAIMDTHVRSLPTHQDIRMIDNRLSALDERSRNLLDGMRRIEQHLMDR